MKQYRDSTMKNYYCIWKTFNEFFIRLDNKPDKWEDRITLFVAYLINTDRKSTTVKSYISAIKAVLANLNVTVNEDRCLLNSLTRACRLTKDTVTIRRPIQKRMLEMLLKTVQIHFDGAGQLYLKHWYMALLSTTYYGLFRVGKLRWVPTWSKHATYTLEQTRTKLCLFFAHQKPTPREPHHRSSRSQVTKKGLRKGITVPSNYSVTLFTAGRALLTTMKYSLCSKIVLRSTHIISEKH